MAWMGGRQDPRVSPTLVADRVYERAVPPHIGTVEFRGEERGLRVARAHAVGRRILTQVRDVLASIATAGRGGGLGLGLKDHGFGVDSSASEDAEYEGFHAQVNLIPYRLVVVPPLIVGKSAFPYYRAAVILVLPITAAVGFRSVEHGSSMPAASP